MSPAPKASNAAKPAWPLDPAWVAIFGAALVLILALVWLGRAPGEAPPAAAPRTLAEAQALAQAQAQAERIAELEGRLAELAARTAPDLGAVERRIAALEGRPQPAPVDLGPLQRSFAALEPQLGQTMQQAAQQAEQRAVAAVQPRLAELAQAAQQAREAAVALERRITEVAQQGQARVAALEPRLAEVAQRAEARAAALEPRLAEVTQRAEARAAALEPRLAEVAQQAEARAAALEPRLAEVAQQSERRAAELAQRTQARLAEITPILEAARMSAEASAQRTAAFEQRLREVQELAARAERALAARAASLALQGGLPLGDLVQRLGAIPPAALARYAEAPPPTLASLRAAFEEAARNARGPGTDDLAPRLQGLVTVRRSNETLFGLETDASLDRARAALAEGNIEEAVSQVARLPERAREAMRPWTEQAEALIAARAALRNLQAG